MDNRLPAAAAFISLWGAMFACGGLAVHTQAPMSLVLLSIFSFPLLYAVSWHLYVHLSGPPSQPKRLAPYVFFLNFFASDALQLLNPFALRFVIAQTLALFFLRAGSRLSGPVTLQLPFQGSWLVGTGGTTRSTSHSWTILAQRCAYDFVIGRSFAHTANDPGTHLADYAAYGQPIFAPSKGRVVAVRRAARDALGPGSGWLDWWTTDPRGNHVLIEFRPNTFVLLAHLRPHSVLVKVGQEVEAGEKIGECGNSGRSTEPHLHLHCQQGPGFAFAVGLPLAFSGCSREPPVRDEARGPVVLQRGMQVEHRSGEA